MQKTKQLIREPNGVSLITLAYPKGRGWIAKDESNRDVFIGNDAFGRNPPEKGDEYIAATEKHQNAPAIDLYAAWAVAYGVVTMDTINNAITDLKNTDAILAADLGTNNGDILYHAGIVAKFVKQDRRKQLDPAQDIWYSIVPDECEVGSFENDDEFYGRQDHD